MSRRLFRIYFYLHCNSWFFMLKCNSHFFQILREVIGIMPNTKSALKNLRKSERRRLRNKSIKSATKTYIKKFLNMLQSGNIDEAREFFLREVVKKIDMAASKGVFHKNKAARLKSRLYQKLNKALASSQV